MGRRNGTMRCILAGNKILARDHSPSVLILEN